MDYHLNELDPLRFQRLVSAILVAKFGTAIRITPSRGPDGGRDAETVADYSLRIDVLHPQASSSTNPLLPRSGRHQFQIKHHLIHDGRLTEARRAVLRDFENEIIKNVIPKDGDDRVDYFYLITNVPASGDSTSGTDVIRKRLEKGFHTEIWWKDQVCAFLDGLPSVWAAFPEMFAGRTAPVLAAVASRSTEALPRSIRVAIDRQHRRDGSVRFRQINLEKGLAKLFVDLEVEAPILSDDEVLRDDTSETLAIKELFQSQRGDRLTTLQLLCHEVSPAARYIILQGGPGQGKSTVTQMATQLYRELLSSASEYDGRWILPRRARLPFRIELRLFAEWLSKHPDGSVEGYLADVLSLDSGGGVITVEDVHSVCEQSPVLFVFDGLDEVGSEELRDHVLTTISEVLSRLESGLGSDVRAILTTRPPAIAGKKEVLPQFTAFTIAPLDNRTIDEYVDRWLLVQESDVDERARVRQSFERRRQEAHVGALVKNPMQLSVLLHFIRLKGEAFPDRRAELYREYFQVVIDRDVEKSSQLRAKRDLIEALHEYLGYRIHALTEAKQAGGALDRRTLLQSVSEWLVDQGHTGEEARRIFNLGQERLGLIVTLRGEGEGSYYGFEVQPIREYFAAAYINSQITGDAHGVFQELARRTFWREVALFLAGLRRPNEKADLVLRAKQLDQQIGFEWRQDGRSIVLQLLKEGVFTQPWHVFIDALDFVVEAIDTTKVPVQATNTQLSKDLPLLLRLIRKERYEREFQALLSDAKMSSYVGAKRCFEMAAVYYDPDVIVSRLLADRRSVDVETVRLRLEVCRQAEIDIASKCSAAVFCDGLDSQAIASELWFQWQIDSGLLRWDYPVSLHGAIVRQAALNPRWTAVSQVWDIPEVCVGTLAGVRLAGLMMLIARLSDPRVRERHIARDGRSLERVDVVYDGLGPEEAETVRSLIEIIGAVLDASCRPGNIAFEVLSGAAGRLTTLAQQCGVAGLLASRCIMPLLRSAVARRMPTSRVLAHIRETPIAPMLEVCAAAYGYEEEYDVVKYWQAERFGSSVLRPPTHIRLPDGRYEDLRVCRKMAYESKTTENALWIKHIPYPLSRFDSIASLFGADVTGLIGWLWNASVYGSITTTQDSDVALGQICQIAAETQEIHLMRRSLFALSLFEQRAWAGAPLLLRLVRVAAPSAVAIRYLFRRSVRSKDPRYESEVFSTVAQEILDNWRDYSFDDRAAAASYLLQTDVAGLEPLWQREAVLGLTHRRPV